MRRTSTARAFAATAAAAYLTAGCAPEPGTIYVPGWTLMVRGREDESVTLPAHVGPKLLDDAGAPVNAYTLASRVAIPPELRGRELTFAVPALPARAALYVGGHRVEPHALPSLSGYREPGPQAWHIPPDDSDTPVLEVALEIEQTWIGSGWLDTVPRLSATLDGDPWTIVVDRCNRAAASVALAAAGIGALVWGALFALDRRRTADARVAVACLGGAAYAAYALGLAQGVLGTREGIVAAVLVAVGIVAAAGEVRRRGGIVVAVIAAALSFAEVTARVGFGEPWRGLHLAGAGIALMVGARALGDLRAHARGAGT